MKLAEDSASKCIITAVSTQALTWTIAVAYSALQCVACTARWLKPTPFSMIRKGKAVTFLTCAANIKINTTNNNNSWGRAVSQS